MSMGRVMPIGRVGLDRRGDGRTSVRGGACSGALQPRCGGMPPRSSAQARCAPQRAPAPGLGLDHEVEREYGGRFLSDYTKKSLLGKGACGAVWLATSQRHDGPVAVKQVAKGSTQKHNADIRSAAKEIRVGELLFGPGGVPRLSPNLYPGIRHITRLLDFAETKRDLWMVQEYGGAVLSKALFEVKGEFASRGLGQPRERVYRVHHLPFYQKMKRDPRLLKRIIRQMLEAIRALSDHAIVHSDLKPENLLLDGAEAGREMACEVRLCDFGSAFIHDQPEALTLATPEYMPPEALETYIQHTQCQPGQPPRPTEPWSFDIWSLGAIVLELCYGVPHYLSYKCRVAGLDGKDRTMTGILAVQGRDHDKIRQRQEELVMDGGLHRVLQDAPGVPLSAAGQDLLQKMLAWDPRARISPAEALAHPYLAFD